MKTPIIMEVCARDGWQNLKDMIPMEKKLDYIRGMLDSGIKYIQVGSFVHPKVVPQMADTGKIAGILMQEYKDVHFDALVPNMKGAALAHDAGIRSVSYVISVSESHNKANLSMTHEQSWNEFTKIMDGFDDMEVTLSLATAFGCPFEGRTSLDSVLAFVQKGADMGIRSIELADTIGSANPAQVEKTFSAVKNRYPEIRLSAHMHDTRNNGVIDTWMAAQSGADIVHGSLGGLGGCPFAPGASGNTSTEDLAWLLEQSGMKTGIDVDAIIALAKKMKADIPGVYSGHQINIEKDFYGEACRVMDAGKRSA